MTTEPIAPGPKPRFLVGNLPELASSTKRMDRIRSWHREYGDVMRLWLGTQLEHLVCSPEAIQHVLLDNAKNYPKSNFYNKLRPMLGNGLLTSAGESWLAQRRLMAPHFHAKALTRLADDMQGVAADWVERRRPVAEKGRELDMAAEMMGVTLRVVGKTLLQSDLEGESATVAEAMTAALEETNRRLFELVEVPTWWPSPRNRTYQRAIAALDQVVYRVIEANRREPAPASLIGMLVAMRDEDTGEGMSDRQLRDEVVTIMLAGHETTANALSWTLYLLARHPEAMAKLRAEVDTVLEGRTPVVDDLNRLTYTGWAIQEGMRLYPPIPIIQRQAIAADTLVGYPIPAGSLVGISLNLLHRNPKLWDRPDAFEPERFAPEPSADRHRFAYLPFGAGGRICLGNNFAMMESKLILATIVQAYDFTLRPGYEAVPHATMVLRPEAGVPMTLQVRKGVPAQV